MPSRSASTNVTLLPRRDAGAGERRRQAALDSLAIVDTQAETAYDDIARLAQTLCGVPIALVSLVDHDRQWFKARVGTELTSLPRGISFCDHTIRDPSRVMQIEDATRDPRFRDNPLVTGELECVRFYAGAPIITREGEAVGAVCVVDRVARTLDAAQLRGLATLARQVGLLLELRVYLSAQRAENDAREGAVQRLLDDRDELQRRHDDLKRAVHRDPLTGLLNRAALTQLQKRADAMARLHAGRYVLGMVDIDHFKQVNDRHGHLLGDAALRMVADTIAAAIRKSDLAVRYGGEEFLLVFPDTALAGAFEVAERIRDAVQRGSLPFPVTVSVGLAAGDPHADTPEEVFERADQALYRAKSGGRNRVIADDTPRL